MKLVSTFVFLAVGTAMAAPTASNSIKKALLQRQDLCNEVFFSAVKCQLIENDGGSAAEAEQCVIATAEVLCEEAGLPVSDCVSTFQLGPMIKSRRIRMLIFSTLIACLRKFIRIPWEW
jgi:hypothetical protein